MMSKRKRRQIVHDVLIGVPVVLGVLAILFPLYLVAVTAFKTAPETAESFFSPPRSLHLDNFFTVFQKAEFGRVFLNSIYITVVSAIVIAVFVPMVSYAIARNYHKRLYRWLYVLFILGIFIPFQVTMLPQIKILSQLGLMNQNGLIIMYATFSLIGNVFLQVGYIRKIPRDMEEAAYVDGASVLKTFFLIVYPVIKPIVVTTVIIHTLFVWNDYLLPLLVLNKDAKMFTLPLFQASFASQYSVDYNTMFAAFFVSIIPVTIVYAIFQKHIINGLLQGALKG